MLKILKRIVQEVSTSRHLADALSKLVFRVQESLGAEVSSVYLIDHTCSEYVLVATQGFKKTAEYRVRFPLNQGLIGLVGRREEPINLNDATLHPDFVHDPLLSDAPCRAFLGVPIIQHRKLYGVMVLQHFGARQFEDAEEAFNAIRGHVATGVFTGTVIDRLMLGELGTERRI